ncbi:MAG: TolC family protein [Leptospiraceae bacterium]|nr:TolC family protein [Leptospiraceae bacterium]
MIYNLIVNLKNQKLILLFLILFQCNHEETRRETKINPEPLPDQVINETKIIKRTNETNYNLAELFHSALQKTERIAIKKEAIIQAEARKDSFFASFFPTLAFRYQQFVTTPNHTAHDREIRNRNNLINAYSNENYGTNISTPYNITNSPVFGGSNTSTATSPLVRPGARLVLHIPIMTGLNEWTSYKNSKHEVKLRHLELRYDEGRMFLEIAQAYYNLLQLESNLENKKQILKLTNESKSELERRVNLGRNKSSELSSITAQLAKLEAEILGITDTLSQMRDTMAFLTGLDSMFKLQNTNELPVTFDLSEAEKTVESRHDVNAAKLNLEIAKSEVLKAYGGHLPTASIDTFYTFPTGNTSGGNSKDLVNQFVLQIPLLSMGTVSAAVKQAESLERQAGLQLTQSIRFAREEVRKAYNSYSHTKLAEESYMTALNAMESNYKTILRDYNRKSANILDLLTSEIARENAKEDLNRIKLQKQLNLVWLKVAIGEYPDKLERPKE